MWFVWMVLGLALIVATLFDVFSTVIVPRPVRGGRLSTLLYRWIWPLWRASGLRVTTANKRETLLGIFAPLMVIASLALWEALLMLGFGGIVYGLRDQIRPVPHTYGEAVYLAGSSLLTIGYGDLVARGGTARFFLLVSAVVGLGIVAVVITFLYSIFASFQRRETFVVGLDALAGAPPSAVHLLLKLQTLELAHRFEPLLAEARGWCSELLESHLAYPVLMYFRSSHANESWIATLGTLLDASTLAVTAIDGVPRGEAILFEQIGAHLTGDLADYFSRTFKTDRAYGAQAGSPGIERAEFEAALERLEAAGYRVLPANAAWPRFAEIRAQYAADLNVMARYWAIPPTQWIGDRSSLAHGPRLMKPTEAAAAPKATTKGCA